REIRLAPTGRQFWIVWCGIALSLALAIYRGGLLGNDAPPFHLPLLRRVVDGTYLSLRYVSGTAIGETTSYQFPLWHIVQALMSMLAGVEPAHVWYYMPSFLMPVSVLGIYLLTKALFNSDNIAALSTPVYLLAAFYFHRLTFDSGVPFARWRFISWPGGLNMLVLLPVVLIFLVYYLRCQSSRVWTLGVVVFVLGFVMGAIHSSQLFFMLTWLVVFLATYTVLIGWNRQVLTRAVGIVLLFAIAGVTIYWFADTWLTPDRDLSYFQSVQDYNVANTNWHAYRFGFSWSPMEIIPMYPVVGAMVLFPLLLVLGRKRMPLAVAFIFAGWIAPPLLFLEPHIRPVALQVIPHLNRMHWQLQFLASVLILTAAIGVLLPWLDRWLVKRAVLIVRRTSVWVRLAGFLAICVSGALLIWFIANWPFLRLWVLFDQLKLSPLVFFAYLAFVVFLAMLNRFRRDRREPLGTISHTSHTWKKELQYPFLALFFVVICAAFLTVPGLFSFEPIKGQPLLESDMNAGVARFHDVAEADEWWDPGLIDFLRAHTVEDAVIWSGPWPSRLIPVYINRRVKWVDMIDLIEEIEKVRSRDPTYILILRPFAPPTDMNDLIYLSSAFRADGGLFERVYESAQVMLFRMSPASQEIASKLQLSHVLAGNAYFVEVEWGKAIAEYEAALTLDPDDALAHFGLGRAYQAQDEMEQAIAEYEKVIAANPDEVRPRLYLAQAHAAQGEVEKAIAQYQRMIELAPDNADGYAYISDAYKADDRIEEAVGVYVDAVAANPDRAWAHLGLGQLYQEEERVAEAIAEYQKAIELEPTSAEAYIQLGELYEVQGRTGEAVALYRAATQRNPRAAWPHIELGKMYLEEAGRDETD
ncbi:MAG: tetratricopeptide repeat protein, partial [Anaerolineales bacterium]